MFLKFVVFCVLLTVVGGNRRTCFCSYKIGYGNHMKTSDQVWNFSWDFHRVTCRHAKRYCPEKCKSYTQKFLLHPEKDQTGRDEVCRLYGKSNANGIGVWSGSIASSCEGRRYQEIVATGKICCRGTCESCTLKYQVKNEQQKTLNISVNNPSILPAYSCGRKQTELCENDCKQKLLQSSFGRTSVDSYSGQKACNVLNRAIPKPGADISVSYDIGDGHSHQFPVGTGVCCGCKCRASYSYGGQKHLLKKTFSQPHATKYFDSCDSHNTICSDLCRTLVKSSLSTTPPTTAEDSLGNKVCREYGRNARTSPGIQMYMEYDIGRGFVKEKMENSNFCCVTVPPTLVFSYKC